MKAKTITINYGEKRTGSYQAVEYAMSVELELSDDDRDNVEAAIAPWNAYLRHAVTNFAGEEILRVIAESQGAQPLRGTRQA